MLKTISYYIQLTKPTIMALVLFTGATSLIVEGTAFNDPAGFFFILLGLYLPGAALTL